MILARTRINAARAREFESFESQRAHKTTVGNLSTRSFAGIRGSRGGALPQTEGRSCRLSDPPRLPRDKAALPFLRALPSPLARAAAGALDAPGGTGPSIDRCGRNGSSGGPRLPRRREGRSVGCQTRGPSLPRAETPGRPTRLRRGIRPGERRRCEGSPQYSACRALIPTRAGVYRCLRRNPRSSSDGPQRVDRSLERSWTRWRTSRRVRDARLRGSRGLPFGTVPALGGELDEQARKAAFKGSGSGG